MLPGHNAASFSLRSHQGPLHSNESRTNNHLFPLKTLPTQAPFFSVPYHPASTETISCN